MLRVRCRPAGPYDCADKNPECCGQSDQILHDKSINVGRTGDQMKKVSYALSITFLLFIGITTPTFGESAARIDLDLPGNEPPASICVSVLFRNNYFLVYSEHYVEGFVTEGRCAQNGPRLAVHDIRVDWVFRGENRQRGKSCETSSICAHGERRYGTSADNLWCASVRVEIARRERRVTAGASTDNYTCPY